MKRRIVRKTGLAALAFVLAVVLLEGASAVVLYLRDGPAPEPAQVAERLHTEYDAELGWIHKASFSDADLYGPGLGFTSNSQRFRAKREFSAAPPDGVVRAVCVGDSFTLGYGVGDGDSWPARLDALDPRLECVNMGQGGYGIDQAWLWYRRDARELEHSIVLFAFIADDFRRMRCAQFLGYAKPLVRWRDGALEATNVPTPTGAGGGFLAASRRVFESSRTVALARRILGRPRRSTADPLLVGEEEAGRVLLGIFDELHRDSSARGRKLALLPLPSPRPRDRDELAPMPAEVLAACAAMRERGVEVLDLEPAFLELGADGRRPLFIVEGELQLVGAAGHYTAAGAEFVARRVHERLLELGWLR